MAHTFIIFLEPGRDGMVEDPTEAEQEAVAAHFRYYTALHEQGTIMLAGRTTEPPYIGIAILRAADRNVAETLMRDDPGVQAGAFAVRLQSFGVALPTEHA
jgi:uncharacterized protein YciI